MPERIESVLQEDRRFSPTEEFRASARLKNHEDYDRLYRLSLNKPEEFWGSIAKELHWFEAWHHVAEWKEPFAKWFVGGKTNLSYN